MRMEGNARTRFTPKQRAELWERWRNGQCIADIARALERRSKSGVYRVLALNGGISPAARRRAPIALALEGAASQSIHSFSCHEIRCENVSASDLPIYSKESGPST